VATGQRDPAGPMQADCPLTIYAVGGCLGPEARKAPTEVPPTFPGEATTAVPSGLPGGEGDTAGPDTAAPGADEDESLLGEEQAAFP
jgi:hypothetical protein